MNLSILKRIFISIEGMTLCLLLAIVGIYFLRGFLREKEIPTNTWYVEKGLGVQWVRILREAKAPEPFKEIRVWDGDGIPEDAGILIATKPRQDGEEVTMYYRLSYDLQYEGAMVLALDPWMIFRKHTDPALKADRILFGGNGGDDKDGVLLIPGKDPASVRAWTARINENNLFDTNLFPDGAQTYTWQDVFYRLMSDETAWVYAPLSAIRRYPNFRKSILTAEPFPEKNTSRLQATLLWAVPLGSPEEQKKMGKTIAWLKKPETQTIIADNLEWIPADPYGKPYDPVSMSSHRNWLTATYIYELTE
jgi:hypothetical protein